MNSFRVVQIDHVEMFVPDRREAAAWYQRVLGLEVIPEFQDWAAGQGPLMISSDGGSTKLALFEGQPQEQSPTRGFHRVAFRVGAEPFVDFLRRLGDLRLNDSQGRPITSDDVFDHEKGYSIYFLDPYGHRLEVTTYECEATRAALAEIRKAGAGDRLGRDEQK